MRRSILTSALLLLIGMSPHSGRAEGLDPAAKPKLDALISAYKKLPAYSDTGTVSLEVKIGKTTKTETTESSVAAVRPNKVRVKTPLVEIVSDGKAIATTVPPVRRYFKSAAPARLTHNDLVEGPLGSFERGGSVGMPIRVLLTFLLDDDPAAALLRDATAITAEKDVKVGDVTYSVLKIDSDVAPPLLLLIDPKTNLLARIEVKLNDRVTPNSAVPGNDVSFGAFSWSAGKVSTEPGIEFDTKPTAGFKEIVGLDAIETERGEHALVGKPSPEFTLTVLGTGGKTSRSTIADLRGKVVLIDFWATWCGPCRKEMPDIAKLTEALEKAGKAVTVVALSIDQPEEADLKGLEKKVRDDIKTLGFDIDKLKNGMLALDASGTTARAFGVSAIPTLVLLDAKGIVRAVHVGMTERDILEAEIDAVLAGKAIPKK